MSSVQGDPAVWLKLLARKDTSFFFFFRSLVIAASNYDSPRFVTPAAKTIRYAMKRNALREIMIVMSNDCNEYNDRALSPRRCFACNVCRRDTRAKIYRRIDLFRREMQICQQSSSCYSFSIILRNTVTLSFVSSIT